MADEELPQGAVVVDNELPPGATLVTPKYDPTTDPKNDPRNTPFVQRAVAGTKALREGNVKDFLGNVTTGAYELGKPEIDILSMLGVGGVAKTAGQAALKGSLKPAAHLVATLGAGGLTEEGLRRAGVPAWLAGTAGAAVGTGVGGALGVPTEMSQGGIKGLLSRLVHGVETPEWSPLKPKAGIVTPLGGAAPVEYGSGGTRPSLKTLQTETPLVGDGPFKFKVSPDVKKLLRYGGPHDPLADLPKGSTPNVKSLQKEVADLFTPTEQVKVKAAIQRKLKGK